MTAARRWWSTKPRRWGFSKKALEDPASGAVVVSPGAAVVSTGAAVVSGGAAVVVVVVSVGVEVVVGVSPPDPLFVDGAGVLPESLDGPTGASVAVEPDVSW